MTPTEELEHLRQQVRELTGTRDWPAEWGLSRAETALLSMLVSRNFATRDALMSALYSGASDPPGQRIIDTFVGTLRRKLGKYTPVRIRIYAKYGSGYYMPLADRESLLGLTTS